MKKDDKISPKKVVVTGVEPLKTGFLNTLKGGFSGFDQMIPHGRYLYVSNSTSDSFRHSITNFASSIYQENQSECYEFNNSIICFNENELNYSLACLSSAGLLDDLVIHDLTSENRLGSNAHKISLTSNLEFIESLFFTSDEVICKIPFKPTSLYQSVGYLALESKSYLTDNFSRILETLDHHSLEHKYQYKEDSLTFNDISKAGAVNLFLCDSSGSGVSSELAVLISKAISRHSVRNKVKSRLLVSDCMMLDYTSSFIFDTLLRSGKDSSLFKEIYVSSSACSEIEDTISESNILPNADSTSSAEILVNLVKNSEIDAIFNYEDGKVKTTSSIKGEILTKSSLASKVIYGSLKNDIKYMII